MAKYLEYETFIFKSRKPIISNIILGLVILLSVLGYSLILIFEPEIYWILLLAIVDVPLIGYLVISINSIRYTFSNKHLDCSWFGGSYNIEYDQIVGYFKYKLPLFEIHWHETNFIGSKITRKSIGKFILLSPSLRTGLIIEIDKSYNNIEKIFITPKKLDEFIIHMEKILYEYFGRKFEEFNDKFYIKNS